MIVGSFLNEDQVCFKRSEKYGGEVGSYSWLILERERGGGSGK